MEKNEKFRSQQREEERCQLSRLPIRTQTGVQVGNVAGCASPHSMCEGMFEALKVTVCVDASVERAAVLADADELKGLAIAAWLSGWAGSPGIAARDGLGEDTPTCTSDRRRSRHAK